MTQVLKNFQFRWIFLSVSLFNHISKSTDFRENCCISCTAQSMDLASFENSVDLDQSASEEIIENKVQYEQICLEYILTLSVPRWCFFFWSFLLFMFRVCHAVLSVHCSIVVTCWERAGLLALLCVMFSCVSVTFPCGVTGVVLDYIDSWSLPSSLL